MKPSNSIVLAASLNFNGESVLSRLAQKGLNKQVNQLLECGADKREAIRGYATGGHAEKAKALYSDMETKKTAVCGFFLGRHVRHAMTLMQEERELEAGKLFAMAMRGEEKLVNAELNHPSDEPYYAAFVQAAIKGYALTNNEALLNPLLKGSRYYPLALEYAAKAGHDSLVSSLLKTLALSPLPLSSEDDSTHARQTQFLLNHALRGFSAGRHYGLAKKYIRLGANVAEWFSEMQTKDGLVNKTNLMILLAQIDSLDERRRLAKKVSPLLLGSLSEEDMIRVEKAQHCLGNCFTNGNTKFFLVFDF